MNNKVKGKLFVLSGPSGVGKGTVLKNLKKKSVDLDCSISATTRDPRPGEVDGEDYFFISKEKFFEMKANDEFIETAKVHNNYYGTPRKNVDRCLANNENIILEIDIQGAKQIKDNYPEAILIFLVPPSFSELKNRLEKRDSEDENSKQLRLKNAKSELQEKVHFDYEIINDKLTKAVKKLQQIIQKETSSKKG